MNDAGEIIKRDDGVKSAVTAGVVRWRTGRATRRAARCVERGLRSVRCSAIRNGLGIVVHGVSVAEADLGGRAAEQRQRDQDLRKHDDILHRQ